jgi:hypothetical protein
LFTVQSFINSSPTKVMASFILFHPPLVGHRVFGLKSNLSSCYGRTVTLFSFTATSAYNSPGHFPIFRKGRPCRSMLTLQHSLERKTQFGLRSAFALHLYCPVLRVWLPFQRSLKTFVPRKRHLLSTFLGFTFQSFVPFR